MLKKNFVYTLVVIITFLIANFSPSYIKALLPTENPYLKVYFTYLWWLLWIILTTLFVADFSISKVLILLGLEHNPFKGLVFAIICVSPMFLSSLLLGEMTDKSFAYIFNGSVLAGFFEELFFRVFLFGLLFRKLRWGFFPAAALGAVLFGMGHLYQGNSLSEAILVFGVTAIGAIWFAWLYTEWEFNIWVPAFFHILMNFSWILFEVSPNAIGGMDTNIFRALTIALSVILTFRMANQRGYLLVFPAIFFEQKADQFYDRSYHSLNDKA